MYLAWLLKCSKGTHTSLVQTKELGLHSSHLGLAQNSWRIEPATDQVAQKASKKPPLCAPITLI